MAGLIVGVAQAAHQRKPTPEAACAKVKEADGYIYYLVEEDLSESIAIIRQKQQAHRQRGEVVPIALEIELERLIEEKRITGDPNFREGRI